MKKIIYDFGTTGKTLQLLASNKSREGCEDKCGALCSITGVRKLNTVVNIFDRCQLQTGGYSESSNLHSWVLHFSYFMQFFKQRYIFSDSMLPEKCTLLTNFHFNVLVMAMKFAWFYACKILFLEIERLTLFLQRS
jgi:hypothetical protein